eukprot:s2440_g13.t1
MLRITLLSGEEVTSLALAELSDVKALKQRLHQQHGLPPRFRQRLLHEGNTLDDAVKLETEIDLQLLIVDFSEPSGDQSRELNGAAWFAYVAKVEALLQLPMHPDAPDEHGVTPLMFASQRGTVEVVQLLLEAGADKDRRDVEGRIALMAAACGGHAPVVQLLLEAGAQKDLRDDRGNTALITAAEYGHASVVQLLLDAGAQLDTCDLEGYTALMSAASEDHGPVVRLLLEAGAAKDVRNEQGHTALTMATDPEARSETYQFLEVLSDAQNFVFFQFQAARTVPGIAAFEAAERTEKRMVEGSLLFRIGLERALLETWPRFGAGGSVPSIAAKPSRY